MKKKRLKSEGHCKLCGQNVEGGKISGHLLKCREKLLGNDEEKPVRMMQLSVEGAYDSVYWMQIAVWDGAKLSEIDSFLRNVWLECCGHLSMFRINGETYDSNPETDDGFSFGKPGHSMSVKLHNILEIGTIFEHEYDFGSTTHLKLEVLDIFSASKPKRPLILFAHNLQPKIKCEMCNNIATQICAQCAYDFLCFCDKCAPKHECGEEMMMPLVNSPRTGICGYCGPVNL